MSYSSVFCTARVTKFLLIPRSVRRYISGLLWLCPYRAEAQLPSDSMQWHFPSDRPVCRRCRVHSRHHHWWGHILPLWSDCQSPACNPCHHRNHCPYCLCSLHVDINPGDRACECGGIMEPISVRPDPRRGFIITQRCTKCGFTRNNGAQKDDDVSLLIRLTNPYNIGRERHK